MYKLNQKKKKTTSSIDTSQADTLYITSLNVFDDEGEKVPKKDWEEFFRSLPGADRAEITEKTKFSTGIDDIKDMECPYCGSIQDKSIPIGVEFFRF
jgi:hypothetical protein